MSLTMLALAQAVKARAIELGFDRVAIGPAKPPDHAAAFEQWLDAGYAGTMDYLTRTRHERIDPNRLLPGARAIVAVALSYATEEDGDWQSVARYARGRDYHEVIRPRLETLCEYLSEAGGSDVRSRAAIDTSAVLERDLAARAGLGWIGKNTNLLASDLGSYFFIGIVLTTAPLASDERLPDRCGTCTACLDACPTAAFVDAYVLDARRCLSYLTIEHRGPIAPDLRHHVSDWLFGCDVCQDVCPWNRRVTPSRERAFAPNTPLGPLESLLTLDQSGFRERFRASAIWRTKRAGLLRNACLVLGNRRARAAIDVLTQALSDEDETVRDAAAWALSRINSREAESGRGDAR